MPYPQLDRYHLKFEPLKDRENRKHILKDKIDPDGDKPNLDELSKKNIKDTADKIRTAREKGKPVMLTFGAHAIKNCLAPVFIRLMEEGWVQHLATNGAGVIHDWEFAWQGKSSEHVASNVEKGQFGIWQETGYFINLALIVGAYEDRGYGESIGSMIEGEGVHIPAESLLQDDISKVKKSPSRAAAAADLLGAMHVFNLKHGFIEIKYPHKDFSVQAAAYRLKIPFTSHPMFGHDIIYTHPLNHGASVGRTAERDFLAFANNVKDLDGGVYISLGSAVMSPMIFEKSVSMSNNLLLQEGRKLENHFMMIVDLQKSHWDWSQGEPPENNPDYYLRFNKSFSRMGGTMRYMCLDNRDFLLGLYQELRQ